MTELVHDRFDDRTISGSVIGSVNPTTGERRNGVDAEGRLGIDHGALRIGQLVNPGWGRAALAYGPYTARAGLAMAVHITNGHNSSENTDRWPGMARWALQWLRGTQSDAPAYRLWRRLDHPSRVSVRGLLAGARAHHAIDEADLVDENLAVGWFSAEVPADPVRDGHGVLMRALGPENGQLEARGPDGPTALVRGVQNIPIHYVVVLRDVGSIVYAASLPGAPGLGRHPRLRPLAIDETPHPPKVWAGIHQSVLGQVGWLVDSRVHEVRVAELADRSWCTSAVAADRPTPGDDDDELAGSTAERGGGWERTEHGTTLLDPAEPIGLIHATYGSDVGPRGLAWRQDDNGDGCRVTADADGVVLVMTGAGQPTVHRSSDEPPDEQPPSAQLDGSAARTIQILDLGHEIRVQVDGRFVLSATDVAPPSAHLGANRVGLVDGGVRPERFEAHPVEIDCPAELVTEPAWSPSETMVIVDDDFSTGEPGGDLGRQTTPDGRRWERTIGTRPYLLDGDGVLVSDEVDAPTTNGGIRSKLASAVRPTGRRTAYTIPWDHPGSASLSTRIMAPGTGPGQGQEGRGGLLLWQDPENMLILNTWLEDSYGGASVSSFFRIGGFEELYDAVWTNVGDRIQWGREYELSLASDGDHYLVHLDGEPVLHRRLTDVYPDIGPLTINRVGIITNWEFGDDTGSRFRSFRAAHT